uniref:Titin n=1 Tax=Mesocestoides corti TaxID=53468 RepID=A0A5K3EFU4_MESCO
MSTAVTSAPAPSQFGNMSEEAPPRLLSELQGGVTVMEGEPVHFDVRVASDSDVQITWLKDGNPILPGSRMHDSFDRGYACLDIEYTHPEDSGMYSVVVRNRCGHVQANPAEVKVIPEEKQEYETVAMQNTAYETMSSLGRGPEGDAVDVEPPCFTQPISCNNTSVAEGQPVRFIGEVSPTKDSTLQIEWLKDGKPVVIGSRLSSMFDRGVIVLDIAYCYPEDSGSYTCVISNKAGRVESSPISLLCEAGVRIVTNSNLTESSINHLKQLDDPGAEFSGFVEHAPDPIPPSFTGPIAPPQLTTVETLDAYFEVPVETGNGVKVNFVWLQNGEPVHFGSRINGKLEMGTASLSFKYVLPSDTGRYVCSVTTEFGRAESEPAELVVETTKNLITETQLKEPKGLQAVQDLEAMLNAPRPDNFHEDGPAEAPRILVQPKPVGSCVEDESVSFRLQYEPSTDPNLVVQWCKDGEPLTNGTRFHVEFERGIASLIIRHTIPEDSGTYSCQITNAAGRIDSDHLELQCSPSAAIITQSNLLEGSEGFKLIQAIEHGHDGHDDSSRYADEDQTPTAPSIDVEPKPTEAILGAPARFLVRMSGCPTPEIEWCLDGNSIQQDSIIKVLCDGGISVLEINKCDFSLGAHEVKVRGHNSQGSTEATTELIVHPADYKLPDLKHVMPENPFRKQAQLKRVECTPELSKAFSKAKPKPEQIIMMEQGSEMRTKNYRSPEVVAAEELLSKVTTGLRKSNRINQAPE